MASFIELTHLSTSDKIFISAEHVIRVESIKHGTGGTVIFLSHGAVPIVPVNETYDDVKTALLA